MVYIKLYYCYILRPFIRACTLCGQACDKHQSSHASHVHSQTADDDQAILFQKTWRSIKHVARNVTVKSKASGTLCFDADKIVFTTGEIVGSRVM